MEPCWTVVAESYFLSSFWRQALKGDLHPHFPLGTATKPPEARLESRRIQVEFTPNSPQAVVGVKKKYPAKRRIAEQGNGLRTNGPGKS